MFQSLRQLFARRRPRGFRPMVEQLEDLRQLFARRKPRGFRPMVEQLEDRWCPASNYWSDGAGTHGFGKWSNPQCR